MTEKRKLPRYQANLAVTFNDNFHAETKFNGIITNINLQGANILTPTNYTGGKIINMEVKFNSGNRFYSILGEIKHIFQTNEGYHLCVEITNYNIYHLKKLVDVFNSLGNTPEAIS